MSSAERNGIAGRARHEANSARPSYSAYAAIATLLLAVFSGQYDSLAGGFPLNRLALVILLVVTVPRLFAERPDIRSVHVVMVAQVAWGLGSAVLVGTLFDSTGAFALVDELVVPALLLFLAPISFAAPADHRLLVRSVALFAGYAGVVSTLQSLGFPQLVFPPHLAEGAVTEGIARAGGPFLQAGANGAAMAMCLPFCFALFRDSRRGWRAVAVLSIAACALGSLLTLTRSAWIGFIAAAVVYFAFDSRLRRLIPAMVAVTGAAIAFALAVIPGLYEAAVGRLGTERSLDDRSTTNGAALSMLRDHPLGGIGWARYLAEVDDYVRQLDVVPLTTTHILAHNLVLSRAAELGAVGALLVIASLLTGPIKASLSPVSVSPGLWQGVLPAACAGWFCVAMFTPMGYAFPNYLLWVTVGITIGGLQITRGTGSATPKMKRPDSRGGGPVWLSRGEVERSNPVDCSE